MHHIHIFTGTHAEVAAASQETLGYPLIDPDWKYPPELTHSVLAAAKVGDKVAYDLSIIAGQSVIEDGLEIYLAEAAEKLAAVLKGSPKE